MPDDIATIIYTSGTTGSIGHTMKGVSLRLDNINPETGEGEIVAKGPNVMPGYYKDPERTKKAFTEDEFFRKIEAYKAKILSIVNKNVNRTSKVSDVRILKEPFEKTARLVNSIVHTDPESGRQELRIPLPGKDTVESILGLVAKIMSK